MIRELQKERHLPLFSSVHFDLISQEMLHLQYRGGFHAAPDRAVTSLNILLFCIHIQSATLTFINFNIVLIIIFCNQI